MSTAIGGILTIAAVEIIQSQTSASPQCKSGEYFNGVSCEACSTCVSGEGAKSIKCTGRTDTVCYDCLEGESYSNTNNSYDPCFPCDDCHSQSLQILSRCTLEFNTVCGKCMEGRFFNRSSSSCMLCDPPCRGGLVEMVNCTYKTNRRCGNLSDLTTTAPPSSCSACTDIHTEDEVSSPQQRNNLVVGIGLAAIAVVLICLSFGAYKCLKRRRSKKEGLHHKNDKSKNWRMKRLQVTEYTPYKDLPSDVTQKIETELQRLSCNNSENGITIQSIASEARLTNFVRNANRLDEAFLSAYKKQTGACLHHLASIVEKVEKQYFNGKKSYLRRCIDESLTRSEGSTSENALPSLQVII